MAGGSADIGIRVFLDDAASQALGSINGALGRMVSTTGQASRAMGGLSASMAAVGVAVGFAAVLLGLGLALKYSVDQASRFQQAMFSVAIATHVPMATALQYSNVLMNLAANSIYTSTQIAEGIVQMGRAGYGIKDIFNGMAQAGIALGIATRSTAVQGFTLLTQAMAAYKAPAAEAMHYSDLLQFGFEHQRGSIAEFTAGLSQVTPAAAQFGVPLREIVAALDVVGPAMKSTAIAGTALRYMLAGIYTPTAGAQKEMVALGLASVDAGGHFHSAFYDAHGKLVDFDTALHILADHLKGLSQEDRLAALKNLFSTRGGQGADILLGNISKLDAYLKQLQQSSDNSGGAMKRWDEVMNTLGGATAGLKSSITDLAVVLGNMFLPALTRIATQANGFVSSIRNMASANPGTAASFLKLGAAISGVGLILTIIISGVGAGILAFVGIVLGVVAGAILLTIGIMALVNWFRNLYNSSAAVRNAVGALGQMFNELGASVGQAVSAAFSTVQQVLEQTRFKITDLLPALHALLVILGIVAAIIIGVVVGALRGLIMALAMFAAGLILVLAGVGQFISGVVLLFTGLVNVISGLLKGNTDQVNRGFAQMRDGVMNIIGGLVTAVLGLFIAIFGTIIGFVVGFVQGVISWFHALSSILVGHSIIPDMMNAIRNAFMSGLNAVIGFISGWVGRIISFFSNLASQAVARVTLAFNLIRTAIQISLILAQAAVMLFVATVQARISAMGASISSSVSSAWNFVRNIISNAAAAIVAVVSSLLGARVVAIVTTAFNTVRSVAASALASIVGVVSSGFNAIVARVSSAGQSIISTATNAWNGFRNAAVTGINNAVSTVQGGVGRIIGVISGLPGQLYTWGLNAMQSFANGLTSAIGSVISAVSNAAGQVANFLHHSTPPRVGPLAGDDQWMPHMMQMMATGVDTHAPLIKDAMNRALSGISSVPQMARIAGPATAPTVAGGGGGGSKVVQLVVNGHILGQAVMDDFTTQLQLNGAGRAFR